MARQRKEPIQATIPGTERTSIEEIDVSAMEYVNFRDERMGMAAKEKEAKKSLLLLLHKHKDKIPEGIYRFDGDGGATMEVTLKPTEVKLKVRKVDPDSEPGSSVDDPTED